MVNIRVCKEEEATNPDLKPIECFGAAHGVIFQQYSDGKPQDSFLIGAGGSERPICIWYDDESHKYRLSSDSKKELKSFYSHITFREVSATLNIELIL